MLHSDQARSLKGNRPLAIRRHDAFPRMKAQGARDTVLGIPRSQRDQLTAFLQERGIARLAEIRQVGVSKRSPARS
jgi:hypothetical protein